MAGQVVIFDDETCLVTYTAYKIIDQQTLKPEYGDEEYSQGNVDKTIKEIARFLEADAEVTADLLNYLRPADYYKSKLKISLAERRGNSRQQLVGAWIMFLNKGNKKVEEEREQCMRS